MKKKIILFILIVIFVYCIGGVLYINFVYDNNDKQVVKEIDKIKGYDYSLKNNVSELYKNEFQNLKSILENNYSDDEYIKSISKLYIIDLYSLDYKLNKYDINLDFVYSGIKDNYILNIQNTLYKYLEDNTDGNRKQDLPIVESITIKDIVDTTYKLNDIEVDAKSVDLEWTYNKDLKYDNSGNIIIIKDNNNFVIVQYS